MTFLVCLTRVIPFGSTFKFKSSFLFSPSLIASIKSGCSRMSIFFIFRDARALTAARVAARKGLKLLSVYHSYVNSVKSSHVANFYLLTEFRITSSLPLPLRHPYSPHNSPDRLTHPAHHRACFCPSCYKNTSYPLPFGTLSCKSMGL